MITEGRKIFGASKPIDVNTHAPDSELVRKVAVAESRLVTVAQVFGADFKMSVKFGQLGSGNFFNPTDNSITLDPQIIVDDKEYLGAFVAGHEGGHRAITRGLEEVGMSADKARELYKKIGFGYLSNCAEDCVDNDWGGVLFPSFKDDCERVYHEQFDKQNAALTTPEINALIARLGYTPKFVSYGSEIIRRWAKSEYSDELDEAVRAVLDKTQSAADKYIAEIPGSYSNEGARLKSAKERWRIFYEKIWPEAEELIKMDIDEEKLRQLNNEIKKKKQQSQNDEAGGGQTGESTVGKGETSQRGELSDEAKEELQKIFDSLPEADKKRIEEAAKKVLEELDDELIKATRGKLQDKTAPPTHSEIAADEAGNELAPGDESQDASLSDSERERRGAEDKRLAEELRNKITGELSEYDKVYAEIASLADELFNRINKIFLPRRHPRWEKDKPTGQRFNLQKVMQFQADKSLYDRLQERKTIPRKIDYRFVFVIDLSGSMLAGDKFAQTLRGLMLLTEVLNRLGIKHAIYGMQYDLIDVKGFDEQLSPAVRQKIVGLKKVMRKDIGNSDGFCLGKASELLNKNKGKDNFIIPLSDGQPAPDAAHRTPEFDLKKVVADIRAKTKQKLIGIGLGAGTGHVADFYPTALPNLDIKQLPQALGALLEDMVKFPERYR